MSSGVRNLAFQFVAAGVAILSITGSARADETVRVFLFAGQSNMVGADAHADQIDELPEFRGAGAEQDDVRFSYILGNGDEASRGWVALKPLSSFGPELTFARQIKNRTSGPIAIIKSAVGGTTAAFDWNPDAPEKGQKLYPRTLQLIRDSLRELDRLGIPYRLEAVMWHQGENDMLDRNLVGQYAEGLNRLVARLRTDLKTPELKWYLAEVSEKGIWGMDHRGNLGQFRQQQEESLKADPLLRWVPTSHLAFEVMGSGQPHFHYGTQGQLQLGEAFAAAYQADMAKPAAPGERRFPNQFSASTKGPVRLFVLAGQRNMEGEESFVAEIAGTAGFEALSRAQDQVLYRYSLGGGVRRSTDWEPLGSVDFLGNFGPELSFGARLREKIDAAEGVAIVKFTHSGAQGPDWFPKGTAESHRNLYPRFIAFMRDARDDLARRGGEVRLAGVFWHTGENDTYFGPYRQNNASWLKQLIEQVRTDLKDADLPWFISEQHPSAPWGHIEEMNAGLRELAKTVSGVHIIETSQLPHAKRHFGTRGTLLLGEEMAKAYLATGR